ncbi:adenylate kinase [Prevotella sp. oral taxon 376]|nr:adenylate kinase [Prevotella sp. oral taxon 376]
MPEFGKRQSKTDVKCRSSANAKTKQMLNAGVRETPKQNRC